MAFDRKDWEDPPVAYRVNPMMHNFPRENRTTLMDAIKDFGYGGIVTNPDQELWDDIGLGDVLADQPADAKPRSWYDDYRKNCARFADTLEELKTRGIPYWVYDEKGYPSGYAGGETLRGHRELEAKGFYMYRVATYEDRHFTYHLDDDSDKIVWAATYPLDTPHQHQSYVQWDQMTPVHFEERTLECDMKAKTVLYIFNVRAAHIGSQATHNTCSFDRYINILDPRAVRRFIDVMYEPLLEECPDAFENAAAVFTDEPSLMCTYVRDYETWNFALCPWVDGLFEAYEAEYGVSILLELPLLFEGTTEGYPVRVRFYRLIGKLVAKAYSGQLQSWCEAHGTKFSGHYLCEEWMLDHVTFYGSYLDVLCATGYPGLDVLNCYPEIYDYNTAKHPQMAVRKKNTNGMMVEICPFSDIANFEKAPVENMTGIMSLLYLSGVRVTHSYFSTNFEEYDPEKLRGRRGYLHRNEARAFNEYVGRMGYLLDGLHNDTHTFVYYGIEDTAAKRKPLFSGGHGDEVRADESTRAITRAVYEAGHDFYYADRDDLTAAAASAGRPEISGHPVETVIIPKLDVMYDESYEALKNLASRGVKVLVLDQIPRFGTKRRILFRWNDTEDPFAGTRQGDFTPVSQSDILAWLDETDSDFTVEAGGAMILKARFQKDGRELWMIDNNTREAVDAVLRHSQKTTATLYCPADGSIRPITMGESCRIPSFRAVFVWFD